MSKITNRFSQEKCEKCGEKIRDEPVYCGNCYIRQMWEIKKLERLKKLIDDILELNNLDSKKANFYGTDDLLAGYYENHPEADTLLQKHDTIK